MSEPTPAAGRGRLAQVIGASGGLAAPEAPFVIEHREALIYMLCQAAELEHAIMCQYLFAVFSLKQSAPESWLLSATSQSGHSEWPDAPMSPKPPDGQGAPWTAHSPSSDSHRDLRTAVLAQPGEGIPGLGAEQPDRVLAHSILHDQHADGIAAGAKSRHARFFQPYGRSGAADKSGRGLS
jgi:hypothetical protein